MRWILARHGESEANAEGWLSGHVDTPLTARGREQARALGAALRDQPLALAVSSDLARAWETARIALADRPEVPLQRHPELRERRLGDWAGRRHAVLREAGELERLTTWEGAPPGGGESLSALAARAWPRMAEIEARTDGPVLVVAHGGVLRVLLAVLDGLDRETAGRLRIPNAVPLVRDAPRGTWARAVRTLDREG